MAGQQQVPVSEGQPLSFSISMEIYTLAIIRITEYGKSTLLAQSQR
jgi:hypothetical protein